MVQDVKDTRSDPTAAETMMSLRSPDPLESDVNQSNVFTHPNRFSQSTAERVF